MKNTIFALASAHGIAGVAVIRVSGPQALAGLHTLTRRTDFPPRKAVYTTLLVPSYEDARLRKKPETLDRALVLFFPTPHSYTGEDIVEYHLHGGRAVVAGMLEALIKCDGHRPAQAGEFTRRAFVNGKMDLTTAEGLADLLAAQTQAQATQALAQMDGTLTRLYTNWRDRARRMLAHAEALLEFPEDEVKAAHDDTLCQEIAAHLANTRGERLREGLRVVILGAPNSGKSSLLNALTQREVAITDPQAGTTRDIIEVSLNLNGYPVTLYDTAGLRDNPENAVEAEGMRRAHAAANKADIILWLQDGTTRNEKAPPEKSPHLKNVSRETFLQIYTKADKANFSAPKDALTLSAKTGAGIENLLKILTEKAIDMAGLHEAPALTRTRHRDELTQTLAHLSHKTDLPECAVEDLRLAVRALGRITGAVDVEDVLDTIFQDFCIGK